MKNLIYFIAGVLFITLISATTVSIMTVKPQTPKSTLVFMVNSHKAPELIKGYIKQGYIVKALSISDYADFQALVVMEKY